MPRSVQLANPREFDHLAPFLRLTAISLPYPAAVIWPRGAGAVGETRCQRRVLQRVVDSLVPDSDDRARVQDKTTSRIGAALLARKDAKQLPGPRRSIAFSVL
jgi:hypothetical protein